MPKAKKAAEYRALVDLHIPAGGEEVRVEAGKPITVDIPAESLPWLLEQNLIAPIEKKG